MATDEPAVDKKDGEVMRMESTALLRGRKRRRARREGAESPQRLIENPTTKSNQLWLAKKESCLRQSSNP